MFETIEKDKILGLHYKIVDVTVAGMHWVNGYVGVTKESPYFGLDYYDENITPTQKIINDINVHGGLTFAGTFNDEKDIWYFGFDTNHYDDDATVQNRDYVFSQIKKLAKQLK